MKRHNFQDLVFQIFKELEKILFQISQMSRTNLKMQSIFSQNFKKNPLIQKNRKNRYKSQMLISSINLKMLITYQSLRSTVKSK